MNPAKPDGNAASVEAARAARRELHEEIQAAKAGRRELLDALACLDGLAAEADARTQAALDAAEERVQAEIDDLSRHITAENAKVLDAIARYLGTGSPEALLGQIATSVAEAVLPVLSGQLNDDMPKVVRECLEDMRANGDKRGTHIRVIQTGVRWQETPFYADNGAVGTVPGRDSH